MSPEPCQNLDLDPASTHLPWYSVMAGRIAWNLHRHGCIGTARKIKRRLAKAVQRRVGRRLPGTSRRTAFDWEEVLDLQPGELVEVRSREEILRTLDGNGKFRGLLFMPDMTAYCGRRLRVFKRVGRMILEGTGEVRRMKDTVLLESALCGGVGQRCDRSCFYFWREAWLKRCLAVCEDRSGSR